VLLDLALIALALYVSLRIRFQEPEIAAFLPTFARSFPVVVGCQIAGLWLGGQYRQIAPRFGTTELLTTVRGIIIGVSMSVIAVLYLYRFEGFSRGMYVIDGAVLFFLLVGARVVIATVDEHLREQRTRGRRVLIYGAGRGGVLLVRELRQNRDLALSPIGFVDDDPFKRRRKLEGLPVLGSLMDLPEVLSRHNVAEILISIRDLSDTQFELLSRTCREQRIGLRRMRFTLDEIADVSAPSRHGR
jgi:UDP-GlcNAc:undecaprenyl-phosphate/decaprenyl-phosphate GlcNAc-1-phosphate transferase